VGLAVGRDAVGQGDMMDGIPHIPWICQSCATYFLPASC